MRLPPRDFTNIGPREGERFPDLLLPDQTGALVDLHAARGGRRALVVFHRSAEWWPFCKTQLVELQRIVPRLASERIALYAVSYDSQDILRAFAEKHGIEFPLLSDQGSHEMRRLGLLNERVQEDHAVYGIPPNPRHEGLPYPGVFALDEAGIITSKRFHESYRERDTGVALIASTLGLLEPGDGSAATAVDEVVRVRAWLDSPTYRFFQRIHLNVEVAVAPGFHVYGSPAAEGLVPLAVELAPLDGVEVGAAAWPAPHPFRPEGLTFELLVHEGVVRGSLPLTFSGAPGAGDRLLRVTIRYQACNESSCSPPTSAQLELLVREVALVDRSLPTSAAKTRE